MGRSPKATGRARSRPARVLVASAAMLVGVVTTLMWATTAGAAGGDALQIRMVDTTDPAQSTIQFLYAGEPSDATSAVLTDNGASVGSGPATPTAATDPTAVGLVFDTSSAMDDSGALVAAKEAAKEWVQGRSEAERAQQLIGVYTASGSAEQIQSLTSDTGRVLAAIDRVAPPPDEADLESTALWGAIDLAGSALDQEDGHQANIVVITANGDTVGGSRAAANGAVNDSAAALFAVELQTSGASLGSLDAMVRDNGGLIFTTETGTDLGAVVEEATTALDRQQFTMPFEAATEVGSVADLVLQVGDQTARASVVTGSAVAGARSLAPEVTTSAGGVSFLQGPLGLVLLVLVAIAAVGGLAWAIIMLFFREDRLSTVLRPYDDALAVPVDDDDEHGSAFAQSAIVQRAVELTEQVARDRGVLSRAEAALERANLPLRAGEALFFYAAGVVVLTLLALFLTRSVIVGLVVGFIVAIAPVAVVSFLAGQRRRKFMSQLPDMLSLLAGTLRAGYSLMQGVEAVSQEVAEPMGLELRRVVTEARLGRPLEESLDGVAERMASPDFAWAVMAIRIQREVGGNLSELLMTVAETMIARERLRREVAALTAEGRVSAYILIALPVGLGAVMFVLNPDYSDKLISTTLGNVLLGAGVVSAVIGYMWMRKIIDIKI